MRWREICWRYISVCRGVGPTPHVSDHMDSNIIVMFFFLQLLVNRSKRKRRRRADKALTGSEKVKVINMRTGKKVSCA